jgi:DNA invertase Pin-like site-specific DNA recombinase
MHVNGAAVQAYRILSALKQSKVQAGVMKARAKRDASKKAGRPTSGQARYGYRRDDAGALVEDPAEQLAIKAILELRAAGLSLRAVARELEARGLMPPRSNKWAASTLRKIESANEVTP